MSRWPKYDPACGVNRFKWILEQSDRLREQSVARHRDLFKADERSIMAEYDAGVDDEEREHFARLRQEQRRRKATR